MGWGVSQGAWGKGEQLNEWSLSMKEEDAAVVGAPRYSTQQPSLSRAVYLQPSLSRAVHLLPLISRRKPTAKGRFIRIEIVKSQ